MKTETIMWLFLAMFMIHDFEEIIMMSAWSHKHQDELRLRLSRRFPAFAKQILEPAMNRSSAAFALAVAEIFVLLTIFILITVELNLYAIWTGMLLTYFIHLLGHIGQWMVLRRYTPAILTSLLTSFYCFYSLWFMHTIMQVQWSDVILSTLLGILLLVLNLQLALNLADRFQLWLGRYVREEG